MKPFSSPLAVSDPSSNGSHADVRRRYLAAVAAGGQDSQPPELESFLSGYSEPELSELRSELESLRSRNGAATDVGAGTIDEPDPGSATLDHGVPTAIASPACTMDFAGNLAGGTMNFVPENPQGTLDHQPGTLPETGDKNAGAEPMTIAGYDILGVLGRGAMGVVYKASQRGLKRTVALKMILSGGHASEHELSRFRSEAEAVAQLQHPNIVQIYEVGQADGRPFFSLEYVDGTSLDKKIRDNPMPSREAADLCKHLASAMDYAHKRGIIHRDLKPANVLLATDGTPKITDFGLAKRLEEEDAGLTRAGTVLGTPSYMAPEQAEGKINELGPLSDVYSLGAVLYDLLTGRAPFRGTTLLETLEQVRTREPVPPLQLQPSVPRDLETICLKCLQKDPARRYSSAGAMAEDLDRFLLGEPILARPISRVERLGRWCKRNPRMAGLIATVTFLVIAWAGTSSGLAWGLKVQKDEADLQTSIAKKEKEEADRQTLIAQEQKEEANRQTVIARERKDEADRQAEIARTQTVIALRNEKSAKGTADGTVQEMIRLGDTLYQRLRPKNLSVLADDEVRKMREEVLVTLRQSLKDVSTKIDAAGGTVFGEAGVCVSFGDLLVKLGQSEEALKLYEQAYENLKQMADANPNNDLTRGNLGIALIRLGNVSLHLRGDAHKARDYYLKSRDLHKDILDNPRDGFFKEHAIRAALSHDEHLLGEAYLALGDPIQARKYFEDCMANRAFWLGAEPDSLTPRGFWMQAQMSVGIASSYLDDDKAVQKHFADSLANCDYVIQKAPKYVPFKGDLAEVQTSYGDALFRMGKVEEAAKIHEEALKNVEFMLAQRSDDLDKQALLATIHERLGAVDAKLGKKAESAKHFQEALKMRKELWQIETNNMPRQAALVLAFARAGKQKEALGIHAQVRPRMAHSISLQLQLARCMAVCANLDADKKSMLTEQAMVELRSATKGTYKNVVLLQTDSDLEALRAQPAFQSVVEQVKSR